VINVFIGFDKHEPIAYHVLAHSIMRRASVPVSITPLYLPQLRAMGAYWRERGATESTDFSLTRFLVPYLNGFNGVSIFMDCDMLCLADITELAELAYRQPYYDVFVVKHRYLPRTTTKFLGQQQVAYPCKNWSSVMVFNGHRSPVRRLTPQYVNEATGAALHQLNWADAIGELPVEWNHLVGEYPPNPHAKLVHYTLGGPYFTDYFGCEYTEEWYAEAANALTAQGGKEILRNLWETDIMTAVNSCTGDSHGKEATNEAAAAKAGPDAA
jgi:hypothetical protein